MPETPEHGLGRGLAPGPDLLSDLLSGMHLSGAVLFRGEFCEPWSVAAPEGCDLAGLLPFHTEHMIPFHIVAAGECWLRLKGEPPLILREGDAVLMPHGDSHRLGGGEGADDVDLAMLLPPPPWVEDIVVEHGGTGGRATIVCGFVQCDEFMFHPLVRDLPHYLHVNPGDRLEDRWLGTTIRHTAVEAIRPSPGSRSMLPRLTELMFVEIMRQHIHGLSADAAGWFAALKDPVAGAALKWLHEDPTRDWSVESLARQVGVSRSVLAERFRHYLDQPPMRYLTLWRLQQAAQRMKASDLPLKAIMEDCGYESEAAFSRAFKRHFGVSPGEWRRRQVPA